MFDDESSQGFLKSAKAHYKNIPDVSVDERHMISMSNLGTLVKFSRYLTAKSMSSLSEEQTRREIKTSTNPNTKPNMPNMNRRTPLT
jgi:hypothetical protein